MKETKRRESEIEHVDLKMQKTYLRAHISYKMQPRDQMSDFMLYFARWIVSGAM